MSKKIKISDFIQDERNFNRHSEKGMELLKKSIESVGIIESFTVSNDDKIISGNARQEKYQIKQCIYCGVDRDEKGFLDRNRNRYLVNGLCQMDITQYSL